MTRQKPYYLLGLVFIFLIFILIGGWLFWRLRTNVNVMVVNSDNNKLAFQLPSTLPDLGGKHQTIYAIVQNDHAVQFSYKSNCSSDDCEIGSIYTEEGFSVDFNAVAIVFNKNVTGIYYPDEPYNPAHLIWKDKNDSVYVVNTTDKQKTHMVALASAIVTVNPSLYTTPPQSPLSVKGADWKIYINTDLGFSIQLPTNFPGNPKCLPVSSNGQTYYSLTNGGPQSVIALAEPYGVVLVYDRDTVIGKEVKTSDGQKLYDSCSDVHATTDPTTFKNQPDDWTISVKKITNDTDLAMYVKQFGATCSVGDQTPTDQPGVYRISIKGDNKGLDETQCPLNVAYSLLYYPAGQRVAFWAMGQGLNYESANYIGYDIAMANSFRFLDVYNKDAVKMINSISSSVPPIKP